MWSMILLRLCQIDGEGWGRVGTGVTLTRRPLAIYFLVPILVSGDSDLLLFFDNLHSGSNRYYSYSTVA